MTKREVAFLLIGLGIGLLLSVVVIVLFTIWFNHMFIVDVRLRPGSILLLVPFLLILLGLLLLRNRAAPHSI